MPDRAERNELIERYLRRKVGGEVRSPLVESALGEFTDKGRLVAKWDGVSVDDLRAVGLVGLLLAAKRFDETQGVKFSTYARPWIRSAMMDLLTEEGRAVRLPKETVLSIIAMKEAEDRLHKALGVEPSEEDLAEELRVSVERVRELRVWSQRPVDQDESDEDHDHDADVTTGVMDTLLREDLQEALDALPDREREVMVARLRWPDGPRRTLRETAEEVGITVERVMLLEQAALDAMRPMVEGLDDYLVEDVFPF